MSEERVRSEVHQAGPNSMGWPGTKPFPSRRHCSGWPARRHLATLHREGPWPSAPCGQDARLPTSTTGTRASSSDARRLQMMQLPAPPEDRRAQCLEPEAPPSQQHRLQETEPRAPHPPLPDAGPHTQQGLMGPGLRGQSNLSPPTSCLVSGGGIPHLHDEKLEKRPTPPSWLSPCAHTHNVPASQGPSRPAQLCSRFQ